MTSLDTPITWVPFMNNKNCSKSNCSIYFPQLGYTIYPPSPPLEFLPDHDDNSSNRSFSPLIIAIIGIFASVFLLVSYYTIISKCSWSNNNGAISSTRDEDRNRDDDNHEDDDQMLEENQNPFLHEPWQAVATTTTTTGLDEAFINSITVCRYRKGDGLVCVTDCSVCLSEFEEDEFVKLLPKCSHGFHVSCIDTWLKSHSNCPLCRANVVCVGSASTLPPENTTPVLAGSHEEDGQVSSADNGVVAAERDDDAEEETVVLTDDDHRKNPLRVYSHDDVGNMELRSIIIDIRD